MRQLSSHSRNESSILADVHAYCFFKIGDHPSLLSWTYDSLVQAIYKAVDHSILLPRAFSLPPFHGSCYARVNTLFCSTYPRNFRNSSLFNLFPARGRHGAPARDSDSDPDSSPVFIIRRCRRRAHIFLSFLVFASLFLSFPLLRHFLLARFRSKPEGKVHAHVFTELQLRRFLLLPSSSFRSWGIDLEYRSPSSRGNDTHLIGPRIRVPFEDNDDQIFPSSLPLQSSGLSSNFSREKKVSFFFRGEYRESKRSEGEISPFVSSFVFLCTPSSCVYSGTMEIGNFFLSLSLYLLYDINSRFVITFPHRTIAIYACILLDLSDSIRKYGARYDCIADGVLYGKDWYESDALHCNGSSLKSVHRDRATDTHRKNRRNIHRENVWRRREGPLDTTSKATLDTGEEGEGPIYTTLRIRFPWEKQPSRKDLPYWKREKVVVAGGWNSLREGLLKPRTPPLVFMIRASSLDNLRLPTIPTIRPTCLYSRLYARTCRREGGVLIYLINSATPPFILDAPPPRLHSWGGKRASKGINAARRVERMRERQRELKG